MQGNLKARSIRNFMAASAVFLAMGGAAFAQTAAPAAPAAPAPGPQAGMRHHMEHGGGMWFKSIDTDGDGTISKAEADALFNKIDTNHDGKLDKNELAAYRKTMMEQRRAEMQAELEARFKAADKNGDGALTKAEVQAGMPHLAKHFDQLDTNHDGKLTLDEIRAGMQKMHEQRMQRMPRNNQPNPAAPSSGGG
ncbi:MULTISPECIES: EF-hand domain-containing protein [unclassified Cupriavidus]|uniref:EF-hand domain-containing protein n=1 Tax=unclassified Cupriavidus TaxID=2640874 RepID=UPI002271D483|nr:EF-hand domain-containing protein [Cupriavidus sp. D39]MCY0856822.1 EF-hand domain-containing protein [Cupriavidus sp. D39]